MCWSWFLPIPKSQGCTSLPHSAFSNVTLVAWNQPWWEGVLSFFLFFFWIHLIFFRADLGSQQNWAADRGFPILPVLQHAQSPTLSTLPTRVVHLLQTDEPISTHYFRPKSVVYTSVLGGVHSMGFDKCVITCSHPDAIIENSLAARKALCVPYSSPLPPLATFDLFTVSLEVFFFPQKAI